MIFPLKTSPRLLRPKRGLISSIKQRSFNQDKTTVLVVQDYKSDQTMRGHFHRKKKKTQKTTHTHIVGDPDQYTDTDHMLG